MYTLAISQRLVLGLRYLKQGYLGTFVIDFFCEGFSIETFTLNSRCGGWLGGCMLTLGVYLL